MKTHKRVISILLALVLFVSCVGAGIIAETGTTSNPTLTIQTDPPVEQSALPTPETTPISSEPTQSATTEEVQSGTTEQSSISVSESSSFTVETTQSGTEATGLETETSVPTVTETVATETEKTEAPQIKAVTASNDLIQPMAVPVTGPYMSDPGYQAVLLTGGATNGQAAPYILWIQGGEILVAVNSNADALSMVMNNVLSTSSLALPELATLSVDNYLRNH